MGDIIIRVIEGSGLIAADSNGKSDPFVVVELLEDPLQKKQKTRIHHKTLNPIWNESFNFRALSPFSHIIFKVWDHDYLKRNDPLGNTQVDVSRLIPNTPNDLWLNLQGVPTGRLHVNIIFTPLAQSSNPAPVRPQDVYVPQPQPYIPQQQQGVYPTPPQMSYYPPQQPLLQIPSAPPVGMQAPIEFSKPFASSNPSYPSYPPPFQAGGPIQQVQMQNLGGMVQGPPLAKFFVDVKKREFRDYILVMDMSGSMAGHRWKLAKEATMLIAPFACQADPDGITLYLFNHSYKKYSNLTTGDQVRSIFECEQPHSTTDLTGVLRAAFEEHFKTNKPTTILVVTDGEPDDQNTVKKEIIRATRDMQYDEELSVSFIQIGDDRDATRFLHELDDSLRSQGAKYDIVDTIPASTLGSMSFSELIHRSIYD